MGPFFITKAYYEVDQTLTEVAIKMKISLFGLLVSENARVPKDATNDGFNIFPNIKFETGSPT